MEVVGWVEQSKTQHPRWVTPRDTKPTERLFNPAMHRAAEPEEEPSQWANPAEVTEVFLYLASEDSQQVNGERFQAQKLLGVQGSTNMNSAILT